MQREQYERRCKGSCGNWCARAYSSPRNQRTGGGVVRHGEGDVMPAHGRKCLGECKCETRKPVGPLLSPPFCSTGSSPPEVGPYHEEMDARPRWGPVPQSLQDVVWVPVAQLLPQCQSADACGENNGEEYITMTKWPKPQDIPLPSMLPLPSSIFRSLSPSKPSPMRMWSPVTPNKHVPTDTQECNGEGCVALRNSVAQTEGVCGRCSCACKQLSSDKDSDRVQDDSELEAAPEAAAAANTEVDAQPCSEKMAKSDAIVTNEDTKDERNGGCCGSNVTKQFESLDTWKRSLRETRGPSERRASFPKAVASSGDAKLPRDGILKPKRKAAQRNSSCPKPRVSVTHSIKPARMVLSRPSPGVAGKQLPDSADDATTGKTDVRSGRQGKREGPAACNSGSRAKAADTEDLSAEREKRFQTHLANMDELYKHLLSRYNEFQNDHANFMEKNNVVERHVDPQVSHAHGIPNEGCAVDLLNDIPPLLRRVYSKELSSLSEESQRLRGRFINVETLWRRAGSLTLGGPEAAAGDENAPPRGRPSTRLPRASPVRWKVRAGSDLKVKKPGAEEPRGRVDKVQRSEDGKQRPIRRSSPSNGVSPRLVHDFLAAQRGNRSDGDDDRNSECTSENDSGWLTFSREQIVELVRERKLVLGCGGGS